MTPRENLDATLAKPPTDDDIDKAVACCRHVERRAKEVIRARVARMDPPSMTGSDAAQFAYEVLDLVYHARWMDQKLRETIKE